MKKTVPCEPQDLPDGCVPGLDISCHQHDLECSVPDASYCGSHLDDPNCSVY